LAEAANSPPEGTPADSCAIIHNLFPKKEQDPKAEALADPVDEIGYGKPQLSQCCILYPPCLFSSRICGFSSRGEFARNALAVNLLKGPFSGELGPKS